MSLIWNNELVEPVAKKTDEHVEVPYLTVERFDNHIYFYTEVGPDRILDLIKKIREIDNQLKIEKSTRWVNGSVPIWLHVQSSGGGLFAGFSVADQLSKIETPVYSIIEGYCASAATLISVACKKRFILSNAFMLIHQLSSVMWGKYEEFKDEMNLLDMAMDNLVSFYVSHTKMSEDDVKELLKRDSWFNAKQCLEKGLVDEIIS